jgi:hypothetical protein
MENILNVIMCALATSLFYSVGILTIHPYSKLVTYLESKGHIYDEILNKGHKIILIVWLITFIITTSVFFHYT